MPIAARRILLLGTENADGTVTGVTTGASQPIQANGAGLVTIYLRGVGATTGGTIVIESADWGPLEAPYSGTWGVIFTQAASGLNGTAQIPVFITLSAYASYRVRISSTITGGGTVLAVARDQSPTS